MKKKLLYIFLFLTLSIQAFGASIEKITLEGNQKVSRDTILFYMKSQEKGMYSKTQLKDDFKSLWQTGFFENITIESHDSEQGKIVKITIKENPIISSVTYKTGKKIKENDIVNQLQESNIVLSAFSYYSPTKLKKTEKILKEMLLERGYNQGKVNITTKPDKENPQQLTLLIHLTPGPKTRIGSIAFPGLDTKKVSPSFLRGGMKHNKPHSFLAALGGKDVYSKDKIDEDLEAIKSRLQQKGYIEAKVGSPTISMVRKRTALGKIQKMLRIAIPVEMGPQYKVRDIRIEGNKIIKTELLKDLVTLKKGEVYNIKKRNKSIEEIQNIYGTLGHIFCLITPIENLDPIKKVADFTLKIHEGETAYVGKLEFTGNTFTKDQVLRREWLLKEGSRFNTNWLKTCITRMRQLGLVDIAKEPEFKPNPENPQKMDITVPVKEINRQNINFNVGYSGYDGWYIGLGYSTKNFLGTGETLAVTLQTGTRSKQYSLSFTEPYLFDLPANLGFSVHKTAVDYPGLYKREGEGFSIFTSARFARFFGAALNYSFENVKTSEVNEDLLVTNPFYYQVGKISAISPTIYYSTVDSPIFPASGTKFLFSYRYSGGLLGGNVNLHKTRFQFVKFIPLWKRHTLGMQFIHQGIYPFGNQPVPIYERIFLGGEQSIRGFDYYRIGPRNENGVVIGGSKAFQLNIEYMVPINQQLTVGLFYDIGNVYDFGVPINLKNVYSSMGMELKVFVPMLNIPFRLIFAYNPRVLKEGESPFAFRFAVGPSFQL
ncbi:MAG: outer membrane protein assembly factor BamA [Candidatus Aminicenantes bacterium]|nr:MAG: outer membrane protein assembly factor BamA [Candidatus Aminicenantes bacterium]